MWTAARGRRRYGAKGGRNGATPTWQGRWHAGAAAAVVAAAPVHRVKLRVPARVLQAERRGDDAAVGDGHLRTHEHHA